jgi:hypothetical protein
MDKQKELGTMDSVGTQVYYNESIKEQFKGEQTAYISSYATISPTFVYHL